MQSPTTPPSTPNPPLLVNMQGITKEFPGVRALDTVDFNLKAGEVHVLFGENGAGKSTLISILAGVYQQTAGTMLIAGTPAKFNSTHDARAAGIGAVFQEFSLVPTMRVAENIFLGDEPGKGSFVDKGEMLKKATKLFAELGFDIDVKRQVISLSRAEQQMVEIAKAIHFEARILILDEPTASLTERETERLFALIKDAKARGTGIVYISHRMQEFSAIADRITVLRDGKLVGTVGAHDLSEGALVEMMTGRAIDEIYPEIQKAADRKRILKIRNLSAWGVSDVSFDVWTGEVLGIAGLVGSGKSRTFRSIIGLQDITDGSVELHSREVKNFTTSEMLDHGIFYLPSDRKEEGLMLGATAADNINLSILDHPGTKGPLGLRSIRKAKDIIRGIGQRVDLTDAYLARTVSKLSGGNQQKILFGKGFGQDREIYIFDEPTVGVDMGTRAALYRLIKEIAESGKAVIVISSDLPEVMHLSHRLLVFSRGQITAELEGEDIQEQTILQAFFSEERLTA